MSNHRRAVVAASLAVALVFPQATVGREATVSIDGQNLHIETLGAAAPNVVFEAGLGNDSTTWKAVTGPIAEFAHVVTYDRAGLGRSLPMRKRDTPITAIEVATRLHALLAASDIRPPYILVGHSLGGLYVQMFAQMYPRDVAGVVLLDSSSADAPDELKTRARLEPGTAAYLEEQGIAESNRQVKAGGPFPDIPVAVIAATDHGPFFRKWEPTLMRLQQQLATLSPQAMLIVAQGSGHDVQLDQPATVVDAVRRIAASAKTPR